MNLKARLQQLRGKLKARLQRWCRYHLTFHVIRGSDMATGVSNGSTPVTGWRWQCVLCGRIIDEIEDTGLEQIANGVCKEKALEWMIAGRKDNK